MRKEAVVSTLFRIHVVTFLLLLICLSAQPVEALILVTVGDGGIARTDNSGVTWTESAGGQTPRLWHVDFVDATHGWAAGHYDNVVHTTDGGLTWSPIGNTGIPDPYAAFGIDFVDREYGWLVHEGGYILHTTDGGATWTQQTHSFSFSNLFAVQFINRNVGWIVGTQSVLLYTTDGGANWTDALVTTPNYGPPHFEGMDFVDASHGWAVGADGVIYHTDNGGVAWSPQDSGTTEYLVDVDFVDRNTGFVGGLDGTFLRTSDGGQTWEELPEVSTGHLKGVAFTDATTGWVVGGEFIHHTTDAGDNWTRQFHPRLFSLNDITAVPPIPEPASLSVLLGAGAVLALRRPASRNSQLG